MTIVIGLTGGIASGKSTVSTMLKEIGYTVIDADVESRLAVEKGEPAYFEIIAHFGEELLQEDGSIDRLKLGGIIFNNEAERLKLNSIVHPAVRKRMNDKKEAALQRNEALVILDIPLLFESKLSYMVDYTVLVYVNEQTQLQRLMERNQFSAEEAEARIQSQMPLKDKLQLADYIIDNNGTLEETKVQLNNFINEWK
ncbi:dephospho-CoA kinase [Cytobacillus horneckiae]|uniref:Dephospho-CoA kinase n=1 Tax=Cytobacillus horneckiae TaxID=549687 RepID=A0A2N0ZMI1_9BACI|nr:dephospho-CoA kinase [Cytobacillus horneckiae]MBN6887959.1 dephospho-CoA kinase [Cytobacillus horneckiae]MCM3179630.1 dephospho-CoA kinase [Cytobacillus horneckiae]MEC1155075.1 dephospho-CoA kinase [Cytobacillus horneckiae]MED2936019.1 dephospho-CoA kinase [Cytobacillus horneckiae]PKG30703.1 dephospho-CoA kinase [Cytobacillus horneckiae]